MSGDGHHHPELPSDVEARTLALESLLVEKGIVSSEAIDGVVARYEQDIGPLLGARVVARAWIDPAYRARLREDADPAIRELGIEVPESLHLVVVEDTPAVHNLIVCTLCSCYPWPVLGLPPTWYKSPPYRARAVVEPRAVMREFGLEVPQEVEVRVWDSSADMRYLVLPERPAGTEGWTEERLAELVTRDSMIGVARPRLPAESLR